MTNDALGRLLNCQRRRPRLVDVLCGVVLEDGQVFADVVAILVGLLAKGNRTVNSKVLVKEGRGR